MKNIFKASFTICLLINGWFTSIGQTYVGDKTLLTQAQVNAFGAAGYTEITEFLYILGQNITDLTPLSNLTTIGGDLYIGNNESLTSLNGLQNLNHVGGMLQIAMNTELVSLSGLDNLTSFNGDINVFENNALESLTGLGGITTPADVSISYNQSLTSITGLDNISTITGDVLLENNQSLTSITALSSLNTIQGHLRLNYNTALPSLTGLNNLTSIGDYLQVFGNNTLTSLTGFDNLTDVDKHVSITANSQLSSLNGLNNLQTTGDYFSIINNDALSSIFGLDSLSSIGGYLNIAGNDVLTSLDGLENLTTVDDGLWVGIYKWDQSLPGSSNPSLDNFCGLYNLIYSNGLNGDYVVENNLYNPTKTDIENGDCSSQNIGILESENSPYTVYPNPFSNTLHFSFNKPQDIKAIKLFTVNGTCVDLQNHISHELTINTEQYPAGLYYLKVEGITEHYTVKIIKQ